MAAGDLQPEVMNGLVARRLAPFAALRPAARRRLLETLAAWLAEPDRPQAIGDLLGIHVQTVRYRLRQLRSLLGGTIDDPGARLELAVARTALRLGHELPPRLMGEEMLTPGSSDA